MSTTRCLFCGRVWGDVSKSNEHGLGEWMRKHETARILTSGQASYSSGFGLDDDAQEFVELPTTMVTKKSTLLTLKTREVCQQCNNGWMSKLEQAAEPLILRLAEAAQNPSQIVRLNQAEARTLALWAQKTAITDELTAPKAHVANVTMGEQLRCGAPIRGAMVWAARNPQDYDLSIALAHIDISNTRIPRAGPADRQILLAEIIYHYLTLFVFIPEVHGKGWPPLQPDAWTMIWPALTSVEYPPMRAVDGPELTRALADHSEWLPIVRAADIRKTGFPPQVVHRN
ncbi:MAG: hypothetical protein ACRDRJ_12155 [Streptosporangiaceae bacterium]